MKTEESFAVISFSLLLCDCDTQARLMLTHVFSEHRNTRKPVSIRCIEKICKKKIENNTASVLQLIAHDYNWHKWSLGQSDETVIFGGQGVIGHGYTRPTLDLETWRRHHSRPPSVE